MSPRLLALIPIAVAINVAMGFMVNQLSLPVYLDTIGTILAVALGGPLAGIITGLLSQAIIGLQVGFFMLAFAPIQVLIALLAAATASYGGFRSPLHSIGWGAVVGLAAGAASAVISYFAFKGVTAAGVTAVATLFRSMGFSLPQAVVLASVLTDLVDKSLAFLVVGTALRALPSRTTSRSAWALRAVGR
jgi:energy-coupling factor transport system substrate-specific component